MNTYQAFYHGFLLGEYDTQAEADDATEEMRLRDAAEAVDFHNWLSQPCEDPNPNQWRPHNG